MSHGLRPSTPPCRPPIPSPPALVEGSPTPIAGPFDKLRDQLAAATDEKAATYTRKRRPVVLVHAEEYDRVDEAYHREKQVQGWSRSKKTALISGRGDELPQLSKNRQSHPSIPEQPFGL